MISRMLPTKENNSIGSSDVGSYETSTNNSNDNCQLTLVNTGDERIMDAADTLVSLAHSASSTPTIESKPFHQNESIKSEVNATVENDTKLIEKTIKLEELLSVKGEVEKTSTAQNKDEAVETACKALLKQLLETCPNLNLASITIRATAVPTTASSENLSNNGTYTDNITRKLLENQTNLQNNSNQIASTDSSVNKRPKFKCQNSQESNSKERKSTKRSFDSISNKNNSNNNHDDADLIFKQENDFVELKMSQLDAKKFVLNDANADNEDTAARKINNMRTAPTLATGRRSKDTQLPPNEERKRQDRRERNKEAAARCRRKREDLTLDLLKQTQELNYERERLRKMNLDLINEKQRLENLLTTHENVCATSKVKSYKTNNNNNNITNNQSLQSQQQQQPTILLKLRKENLSDFLTKQSQEKNLNGKLNAKCLIPQTPDELKTLNQHLQLSASTLLTPTSGNQLETLMSQFELPNKQQQQASSLNSTFLNNSFLNSSTNTSSDSSSSASSSSSLPSPSLLQRPNNLNLKSTRSNQSAQSSNQQLLTPFAFIQNFALALNSAVNGQQAAMTNTTPTFHSNNLSLLMTPTLQQLNTPSAFFSLTPLESTLNALNTPILANNSVLSAHFANNSNNKTNTNNSGDSLSHIPVQSNSSSSVVASSLVESNKVK